MLELSVIVPIYNVEKYLPKCLDSILAQIFQDFELILVDDGSPDGCGVICDEYAVRDKRIRVIHKVNGGVSSARNAGLDVAMGEYIGFVDPDDFIKEEMFNSLIREAKEKRSDIVGCRRENYNSEYQIVCDKRDSIDDVIIYSGDDLIKENFALLPLFCGSVCGKVFRRKRIQGIRFNETLSIGEDVFFLLQACRNSNMLVLIPDRLYCVYFRPNSSTRKDKSYVLKWLEAVRKCVAEVSDCSNIVRKAAFFKLFDLSLHCMVECPVRKNEICNFITLEIRKASYLPILYRLKLLLILFRYNLR